MFLTAFIINNSRKLFRVSNINRIYVHDIAPENIPKVSASSIRNVLRTNDTGFEDGYTCFITNCPICQKSTKTPTAPKVYINKTTGFFSCHGCRHTGEWDVLEKFFGPKKGSKVLKDLELLRKGFMQKNGDELKAVVENTVPLNTLPGDDITGVCKRFNLPDVPTSILLQLDIRIEPSRKSLYIPLHDLDNQIIGYKVIKSKDKSESLIPANTGGVLTAKFSKTKDSTAVLVPSFSDFLVLLHAKVPGNIVCLPHGLKSLPQNVLPNLERFSRLILWFGNDVASWDTARNFAKKLGEKRCLFVRPTDKQSAPLLAQGQDLKAIVASAQPIWHKSITTFANLRQDVLSDLQNNDKVEGVKWKRYPSLNKTLKGHRRGELTILTGPTGSGKTTFISEYSLDLAMQGVNTLWGSFEIRNSRLARTMLQQLAGFPLSENLDKFDEWADKFEQLPIYFMTFHGQQSIKIVMEAVEHATYVHDIAHVVIDNVQFMMGMTEEPKQHIDRFWRQDVIVASFRTFATRKNCHVTLVIHPRKEREADDLTMSSIFGGVKASQEADNILIIQDKRLTSVRGKKYLQVAKNRYTGDLGMMQLEFNKDGLSYAQKKKKAESKGDEEVTTTTTVPENTLQ